MKVSHFSGDSIGGAARAALRLHNALVSNSEINSTMTVRQKMNDDWRIKVAAESRFENAYGQLLALVDNIPLRLQMTAKVIPRSSAWVGSVCAKEINQSDVDLVNLHWICSGFMSIEEIGKITKPLVWTLHDMWPFCAAEHLSDDVAEARWRVGYTQANRNPEDRGLDIDRWVWRRKEKAWKKKMHIVTPSRWMAECVRSSMLMQNWEVSVIPNVLDTNRYKPIQRQLAREILGLPSKSKLILFGAIRGTQLSYKGWDLLQPALKIVSKRLMDVQAVIFGQGEPKNSPSLGMPLHWLGHLHDDTTLALLYSAADVVVVPSRQESFGQVASEAQACGCPVVAFNSSGLRDVVDHEKTGYLAKPFNIEELANGIEWVLADDQRHATLSSQARERALRLWSHEAVVPQYMEIYQRAILNF